MRDVRLHAGIPVKPVYGPEDLAGRDPARDIGQPGEYPFTRGIHRHMYRDRLWTMRQYIGFGTPAETNARFKYLMAHGQDALNVAFDLPTQLGLDSDDPRAEGEVGRVGLAIAAAYVEMMLARGMAVDDFAPRISFNFTCWGKIFEETAKFRAGRRLYARLLRERFGARSPKSWMFRTLIGGGGSAFTVQEPENNIVRGAYIALAAALSGAQTMALPTYDEAYTIPSAKAQLIALRTMQICAEESGAADTADPLAGSYYVETLTNQMEDKILEELAAVERMGGIVEAVKTGAIQAEVARQAYLFEQKLVSGEMPKVAVNCHVGDRPAEADREVELYAFDPRVAATQVARLATVRRERGDRAARAALSRLTDEARGTANLMPAIVETVKAYATLGEICQAMKTVFGEHKEPIKW